MTKLKYSFVVVIFLLFGSFQLVKSQLSNANATWLLTNPTGGGTGQTVSTSGQVNATDEAFSILTINQYTGGAVGVDLAQRLRINSIYPPGTVAGWPANKTTPMSNVYIQFTISPKPYKNLYIDTLSLSIGGVSIKSVKANIYYSTSPAFADSVQIPYTTGLVDGAATNVLSSAALTVVGDSVKLKINAGQTFYLRVYPWIENLTSPNNTKYFCIKNVVISGRTESLPEPSSVIWPYEGNENSAISGPIKDPKTSYSSSLALNASTPSLPISGSATNVMVGTISSVSDWTAEATPSDNRYFQYVAGPKYGGKFVVNNVSMYLGAVNTTTLKAAVFYSKDSTFTSKTQLFTDAVLINNTVEKKSATLNDTIKTGEKIYVRVFPHNTAAETNANLIAIDSVKIAGTIFGNIADPPTVNNGTISYISTTFASFGGTVPSDGGAPVITRGACWDTLANPTIAKSKTIDGSGSGTFKSQIKGLIPGKLYHVRAYATNDAGTGYGADLTFTTMSSIVVPTVTGVVASEIMVTNAKAGGNVTAWGGDTIKAKGICWSTAKNPTIADSKTENGTDLGAFTSIFYPLVQNTKYYFKAYATNSAGTGYSTLDSLTTQIPAADVTKVVAKDGTGDYTTVQAAFDAVPLNYTGKYTIFVKPGIYKEKVTLLTKKVNVVLQSIHPDSTIITFDAFADTPIPGGTGTYGTNGCQTVAIDADDFTAQNITFQNTIKNDKTHGANEQAVALRTNGDRQSFFGCKITGYQDTYYAYSAGRVYMKNCYLEGSVDFIFGKGIVVFDSCQIHMNRHDGALTAANTDAASKFGLVFMNSLITAAKIGFNGTPITGFYLGRPWQNAPRTVFIKCAEPITVYPAGWTSMQVNPVLQAEYKCFGEGADISERSTNIASYSRQLSDAEASDYTLANIFAKTTNSAFGYDWMPNTNYNKWNASILIGNLPAKKYGAPKFVFDVQSSANIPVTFSSSNANVAKVFGDTVFIFGVGSTQIKASMAGNYLYNSVDSIKTFTVKPADLKISVSDTSRPYGQNNPAFKLIYEGFVRGETSSDLLTVAAASTRATKDSAAGSYDIVPSGATSTNYAITFINGKLLVTKVPLTVTAENKSKVVGTANPAFTLTYSGFVNGDDDKDITTPTASCSANESSAAGDYPISLTGGVSKNYTFTLVDGTLTVNTGDGVNSLTNNNIEVYPNPASEKITILRKAESPVILTIINMNGQYMLLRKINSSSETINVSNFPKGVYILNIENTKYKLVVR